MDVMSPGIELGTSRAEGRTLTKSHKALALTKCAIIALNLIV